MLNQIKHIFVEHDRVLDTVSDQLAPVIAEVARVCINAFSQKKKLLIMGNGGSAADAQHFVAELVGRFHAERRALPALCLTGDMATLTAISNDDGYNRIFQRQVEALAEAGDLVLGISTSGDSENILLALQTAKQMGCVTIGLLGKGGGQAAALVDFALTVASMETPRIQEAHITIIHILCELIEAWVLTDKAEKQ